MVPRSCPWQSGGMAARERDTSVHRGKGSGRLSLLRLDRPGWCGHYVKMVHNGIEYGDMQLIGEAYQLLKDGLGLGPMNWQTYLRSGTKANSTASSSKSQRRSSPRRTTTSADDRQDPRYGGTKRHRQVDRHLGARLGHAGHTDWRKRIRAVSLGAQVRARQSVDDSAGTKADKIPSA